MEDDIKEIMASGVDVCDKVDDTLDLLDTRASENIYDIYDHIADFDNLVIGEYSKIEDGLNGDVGIIITGIVHKMIPDESNSDHNAIIIRLLLKRSRSIGYDDGYNDGYYC